MRSTEKTLCSESISTGHPRSTGYCFPQLTHTRDFCARFNPPWHAGQRSTPKSSPPTVMSSHSAAAQESAAN